MFIFVKFIKDLLILTRISYVLYPIAKLFNYVYYWNLMISATSGYKEKLLKNDFYRPFRNYEDRECTYQYIINEFNHNSKKIKENIFIHSIKI